MVAHQVTHLVDLRRVGLTPLREARHDVIPEDARSGWLAREQASRSLTRPASCFRHVAREAFDIRRFGLPVHQGEGRVPGLRDHAVRAQVIGQVMGESDEAVALPLPLYAIDGMAHAGLVHRPFRALSLPAATLQPAQKHAHEAQPRGVRGPHPRQPHHLIGRSEGAHGLPPKLSSKNLSQLPPRMASTSDPSKPTVRKPSARRGKSRLSRKKSGCGGKPGESAEPSP